MPGEFEAKAKQINRRAQKKGGEVESEVRNIFWKEGVAGGELQVAELTVYKIVETTTIIRPERREFCDHSAAGNKKADSKMRERLKNPRWERPKGYTWNHAGSPGNKTLELVKTRYHRRVAHTGSANRNAGLARANAFFLVYDATKEAAARSSGKFGVTEVTRADYYFYDPKNESVFTISYGNLSNLWIREKVYESGPAAGSRWRISERELKEYEDMAKEALGTLKWYPVIGYRFTEGTERKFVPVVDEFGRTVGHVDGDGEHLYPTELLPRPQA